MTKHTGSILLSLPVATALVVAAQHPGKMTGANSEARDLPATKPETVGFSSERLGRLDATMQELVETKQLPGGVIMLARHGRVVDFKAYGKKDLASGVLMDKDAIFRIFSMTKPVTGVAMMILYEQGRFNSDDPLSKYIPEFAHLKVFKGVDEHGGLALEDPVHPPTVGELMDHTAGFTYGLFGDSAVDKMYEHRNIMRSQSLQQMIEKLASIPLLYQPGTRWVYSVSVDIQGYLVEKLSGKSLPDFMREYIFEPLRMKDTGFYVPPGKMARLASVYEANEKGELVPSAALAGDYTKPPSMAFGGSGLVSTAQDYMRFAQMLLNGGALDGARILAPSSVKLMTANHLPRTLMSGEFGVGFFRMKPGFGYGYDVGVYSDPTEAGSTAGIGTFLWDGLAGTWFWAGSNVGHRFRWHDSAQRGRQIPIYAALEPRLDVSSARHTRNVIPALGISF